MAKQKKQENEMTQQATNYTDLFKKIDALQGVEKKNFCKTLTENEKKDYVNYCKERDCEMVTGRFRCFEPLGGSLDMTCQAYPGEVPVKYSFVDDREYTIPKYLAKRLENEFQGIGTWYPTHTHILDANGKPTVSVGKKNRRFAFNSPAYA